MAQSWDRTHLLHILRNIFHLLKRGFVRCEQAEHRPERRSLIHVCRTEPPQVIRTSTGDQNLLRWPEPRQVIRTSTGDQNPASALSRSTATQDGWRAPQNKVNSWRKHTRWHLAHRYCVTVIVYLWILLLEYQSGVHLTVGVRAFRYRVISRDLKPRRVYEHTNPRWTHTHTHTLDSYESLRGRRTENIYVK